LPTTSPPSASIVLHLKIAIAVVAPLMGDGAPTPAAKPNGAHPPPARGKARGKAKAKALSFNGQVFPSRGALAKHLAPIVKRSVSTMIQMLRTNHDDAAAVVRHYQPNGADKPRSLSATATRDHDALALAYRSNELAKGPVEAAAVDAMVEKGRLHVGSVDKAKAELGVVAIRANFGRGAVVHLCTRAQAETIDRTVIATGA
jgi:hypothetical protein